MSDEITIKTNNVPRFILDASELTKKEQREFDYLDWDALERGEGSASFIRYRGVTYDLGEFQTTSRDAGVLHHFGDWDGYLSDTFFSGVLVRFVDDDSVVMGRYFA